jgi:hypothetical protein
MNILTPIEAQLDYHRERLVGGRHGRAAWRLDGVEVPRRRWFRVRRRRS